MNKDTFFLKNKNYTVGTLILLFLLIVFFEILLLIFIGCLTNIFAQQVYKTSYKSDADKIIYVTEYKSDADMIVYETKYKSDAGTISLNALTAKNA